MNSNAVAWFEIYVDDMSRARTFYEAVLKVNLQNLPSPDGSELEMWAFNMDPAAPGSSGALVKVEGYKAGGNSTIVYFGSEDCAVELARVEAAGGRIHTAKMSIGEFGFVGLAFDTEGNIFGLHSMN